MIRVKSETHLKSQVLLDQPNRVQDLQDRDPGRSFKYMNLFVVEFPSRVQLVTIQWTAACQASLSLNISQSLPKFISIKLVMPSNHLILCCPLLHLSAIFPSIRVFSNESAVCIRWPKYWPNNPNFYKMYEASNRPELQQEDFRENWTGCWRLYL